MSFSITCCSQSLQNVLQFFRVINVEEKHNFTSFFKRALSPILVLQVLSKEPMYGYQINQELNHRSKNRLGLALLYPVLYRLESEGFIEQTEVQIQNGRARTYFAIKPEGRAYLEKTTGEFRELSAIAMAMLEGKEAE